MTTLRIEPRGKFKALLESVLLSAEGRARSEIIEVEFQDCLSSMSEPKTYMVCNFRIIMQERVSAGKMKRPIKRKDHGRLSPVKAPE